MIKSIVFSDTHLSDRYPYITLDTGIQCFAEIREYMVENNIQTAYHLGDFFDYKDRIPMVVIDKIATELEKWKQNNLELTVIEGNHDRNVMSTLSLFTAMKYSVTIFTEIWHKHHNEQFINLVPYHEIIKINELLKIKNKGEILLVHYGLKDSLIGKNDIQLANGLTEEFCSKFDLVLAGHYHKHQQVYKNAWQVGSPYQINFGEEDEKKGFMVVDFDTLETEFVEIKSTSRFITFDMDCEVYESDYTNMIVKVRYGDTLEKSKKTEEMFLNRGALKVIFEKIPQNKARETRIEKTDLQKDDLTILKKYIDGYETKLNKEMLIEFAKEIMV